VSPAALPPPPPYAQVLPSGYRVQRASRVSLDGGPVPEAVVASIGPRTGRLGFRSADLQVLSWDASSRRWAVIFDAQRAASDTEHLTPGTSNDAAGRPTGGGGTASLLLDRTADVRLGPVRFARLLPDPGRQVVFSYSESYGGSGLPGGLVVVAVRAGAARVAYAWYGDLGVRYRVAGARIIARAQYWTAADPHCCPVRGYGFTIAATTRGVLGETRDQRPWLGAEVRPLADGNPRSGLEVVAVVPGSPAASALRPGDVRLALAHAPRIRSAVFLLESALLDRISSLDAGARAELRVRRGGAVISVALTLGSLADPSVAGAPGGTYPVSVL